MPWGDETRYSGHYVWQEGREPISMGGKVGGRGYRREEGEA